MKKPKLVIGFSRYRNDELLTKAQFILTSVSGNVAFAEFEKDIKALKAAVDIYAQALADAESRSTLDATKLGLFRENLEKQLKVLGLKIEATANGEEAILAASGYSLAKDNAPIGILAKPENFRVSATDKGMVELNVDAIRGANSYQYEYRLVNAAAWNTLIRSKSSLLLNSLSSGSEYEFRVAGIGTAEERIYSDTIRSFVL